MPEELRTNKAQAIKLFTKDLPGLRIQETTNYRVALSLKQKLEEHAVIPPFLISAVLSSIQINVKPKVYREEGPTVDLCLEGLATYIGNVYIATQQDFDTEIFRSMIRSLSFMLDW